MAATTAAAPAAAPGAAPAEKKRKEIYSYHAPWAIYGLGCSQRPGEASAFRFAIGSFIEEYRNKVQIIQLDEEANEFVQRGSFDHPYPTTKIAWAPAEVAKEKDLLATTGDYLRIWSVMPEVGGGPQCDVKMEALLNVNKYSEYCAPLTSFDWNGTDPSVIGTCSIDTTCTIWDVNTKKVKTQLIAHDKEVYDIAWARSQHVFGTVGADGSLRVFDLRSLEHSTIMYETTGGTPLLRLVWNRMDSNYIATLAADSLKTVVLDVRMPSIAAAELGGHGSYVNGICWAPHSAAHICTVSEDCQALIWDLAGLPKPVEDPILAYSADGEINNVTWSPSLPEWVTVAFGSKLEMLRV